MEKRAFDGRRRLGTVKAAINVYEGRIHENGDSLKEPLKALNEKRKSTSTTRDLHKAEPGPSREKTAVKVLASSIKEWNVNVEAQARDGGMMKRKSSQREAKKDNGYRRYVEVMRQVEHVKQDLSKLKVDMATALEEHSRAGKEAEASSSNSWSSYCSVAELRQEIEEMKEEQVLVELAKIEALKELEEIQAKKEWGVNEFMWKMEEKRRKMKEVVEEIDSLEELESKLALTLLDVNVLHKELKHVREMERKVQRSNSSMSFRGSFRKRDESEDTQLLKSITQELEAAKKELALVKEEGFHFMASMDVVRKELKHVADETAQLKQTEEKPNITVQKLNSKLLRAKSKLEAATEAEEKAKSFLSNLSLTLEQLKTEAEVAKKEKTLIVEETESIKADMKKNESEKELAKGRLEAAMLELKAVKLAEARALDTLKKLTNNADRARASTSQNNSRITISKLEYEYLRGRAVHAEEVADKKVAAAQAWIQAFKASEKERLIKAEIAQTEIRETRVAEEIQVYGAQRSISAKRVVEEELRKVKPKSIRGREPRTPTRRKGNITPSRHGKPKNSGPPALAAPMTPRSTPITLRKKKKVIPSIAKLFSGKKIDKNQ